MAKYSAIHAIEDECEKLVEAGKMASTVPADAVALLQNRVSWTDDKPYIGAEPLAQALETWCAAAAHRQPQKTAADLDMNNLGDRAKAQRELTPAAFTELLTAWGLRSIGDTRKGTRPESADKGKKPDKSNPWANDPANVGPDGRYTANALTRMGALVKVDLAMAQRLAKSAGVAIGATRPAA